MHYCSLAYSLRKLAARHERSWVDTQELYPRLGKVEVKLWLRLVAVRELIHLLPVCPSWNFRSRHLKPIMIRQVQCWCQFGWEAYNISGILWFFFFARWFHRIRRKVISLWGSAPCMAEGTNHIYWKTRGPSVWIENQPMKTRCWWRLKTTPRLMAIRRTSLPSPYTLQNKQRPVRSTISTSPDAAASCNARSG